MRERSLDSALLRGLLLLESSTVRPVGSAENCFGIPAVIDGRTTDATQIEMCLRERQRRERKA